MYLSCITDWWITPCLIVVVTIVYYFSTSTFKKWEKLNVPYSKPFPLFGNVFNLALCKYHPLVFYKNIYNEFSGHKYGGLYQMRTPYLMVRDPELINNVLIKDFSSFTERGLYKNLDANPLSNNMFYMKNPQWKIIRSKLTPGFTSGKLKIMYDLIRECGDELMKNINDDLIKNNNEVDVADIIEKYSTNVIGICAFGLKLDTINDDKCEFRKYSKEIFKPSLKQVLGQVCLMINPVLVKALKLKDFPKEVTDFFYNVFKETVLYREENKIIGKDWVYFFIQARNDLVLNTNLPEHEKLTEEQIIANAFGIFNAGFQTVSSTISHCIYELALNKSIQDKLRQEIHLKLSNNNGQINYELLMDLNYLDMVIAETLRMYPPIIALFRKAIQSYRVPNDSLIIENGQKIIIPVHALHFDSKYYPDPNKFIPERFSTEEKAKRPSGVYLPFGDGPRMCIGKRFAELEMKLAIVEILTKFEVLPSEKTVIPVNYFNNVFTLVPKNGIWLKFKKIN
ncbi:probable cytochrome P450 6a13 [Aphis gossypii]|uniref:Cytochrome P450 monooxygenase CYP6CY48 n=1 Tax=Aphis gossypii TaxID=80765 RepID=A0A6H0JMJ2_APHGO|nr:probable cytochrome P450 6a13 [Aphis gossypii]QIU80509.1 cytochrome P450 monooxygenase CYP6CY48 [Aphis gossypii]